MQFKQRPRVLIIVPDKAIDGEPPQALGKPWMTPGAAMVVASFTRTAARKAGFRVKCAIWNEQIHGLISSDEMRQYDLCLITYLTPSRYGAFRVAKLAHECHLKVIAGGIDVTGLTRSSEGNDELLEHFDSIFVGHLTTQSWQRVLGDWRNDMLKQTYEANEPYEWIMPAWDLVKPADYVLTGVQSSAGCHHGSCGGFCAVWLVTGMKQVHCKPAQMLRNELKLLRSYGVKFFVDYADCFGADPTHYTKTVLPIYKESEMEWATEIDIRTLVGDDGESGLIAAMQQAHCAGVYVGVESLTKKFAKNTSELVRRAIKRCRQLRMLILTSIVLDCEADATTESVEVTTTQLLRWGVHFFQFSLTAAVPGTGIRKNAVANGQLLTNDPRQLDGAYATIEHAVSGTERARWLKHCLQRVYSPWNLTRLIGWVVFNHPTIIPHVVRSFQRIHASAKARKRDTLR